MRLSYKVERWSGTLPPNPAMLRSQLVAEGYEVYQWADSPGAVYGLHMHLEDQSHWIISGSLEVSIESVGTVVLSAGDRDFMPAGCYHSARVVGDVPVIYLIGAKRAAGPVPAEAEDDSTEDDSIDDIISSVLNRFH